SGSRRETDGCRLCGRAPSCSTGRLTSLLGRLTSLLMARRSVTRDQVTQAIAAAAGPLDAAGTHDAVKATLGWLAQSHPGRSVGSRVPPPGPRQAIHRAPPTER